MGYVRASLISIWQQTTESHRTEKGDGAEQIKAHRATALKNSKSQRGREGLGRKNDRSETRVCHLYGLVSAGNIVALLRVHFPT